MKKFLCACVLIFAVSFPAFAGHTVAGGGRYYCDCGTPDCIPDYPGECDKTLSAPTQAPDNGTAELGITLVAILLWLRLKA